MGGGGALIHGAAGAKSRMKVTCDYKTNTLQIIYCLCKHRSTVRGGHSLNSPSYVNVGAFEPFPPMSMNQFFRNMPDWTHLFDLEIPLLFFPAN